MAVVTLFLTRLAAAHPGEPGHVHGVHHPLIDAVILAIGVALVIEWARRKLSNGHTD